MAYEMIAEQTFGGDLNKTSVLSAYHQRIDQVKRTLTPDRLLVFDVTEGWSPLCEFLDVPVPEMEFPRLNDASQFWKDFGKDHSA